MHNFLSISEAASIAIHSLAFIARDNSYSNATNIANSANFSRNHLSKILQQLTKHGYLMSERGPSGGFKLLKDPSEITVLEIFELIDGSQEHHKCAKDGKECSFPNCVYGDVIQRANIMLTDYFRNRTIADIVTK
jgi:Rrf2 family protein